MRRRAKRSQVRKELGDVRQQGWFGLQRQRNLFFSVHVVYFTVTGLIPETA